MRRNDEPTMAPGEARGELLLHVGENVGWSDTRRRKPSSPHSPTAELSPPETEGREGLERMGKILVPASIIEQERLDDEVVQHRTQAVVDEVPYIAMCSHCKLLGTVRHGTSPEGLPLVTMCELRTHCLEDDCWILSRGVVYDASLFMNDHPGGRRSLMKRAGGVQDCHVDYDFHSTQGKLHWNEFVIAKLVPCRPATERNRVVTSVDTANIPPVDHSSDGSGWGCRTM